MKVITVSRQNGSRGDEVVNLLARELGAELVDKQSLEQDLVRYGLPEDRVERYDERKPGFWEVFSSDRDRYYYYLKSSIFETIRTGSHVVVGRGGSVLLSDVPGVLHLRIIAPLQLRVERMVSRLKCDERHARKLIRESDHNRAGYYHFFFDADWDSPDLYDITCNTAVLTPEEIVRIALNILDSPAFCDPEKTEKRISELATAQRIITTILFEAGVPLRFASVDVRDGVATISGAVDGPVNIERCRTIAESIDGVSSVTVHISDIPEAYVGPYV